MKPLVHALLGISHFHLNFPVMCGRQGLVLSVLGLHTAVMLLCATKIGLAEEDPSRPLSSPWVCGIDSPGCRDHVCGTEQLQWYGESPSA